MFFTRKFIISLHSKKKTRPEIIYFPRIQLIKQ